MQSEERPLENTNWVPRVGGHQSLFETEESYQAKESFTALVFWNYGVKDDQMNFSAYVLMHALQWYLSTWLNKPSYSASL